MKERILVISSANIDLSVKAKRFPAAGETLISDGDYAYLPGGKGANASRALAALGADTVFLCRLGVEHKDVLLFIDNIFRFVQAGSEVSTLLGRMPSAVG